MKNSLLILTLAVGTSASVMIAQDGNPRPTGQPPAAPTGGPRTGRPGGPGGIHVLPPFMRDQLELTSDQEKQLDELEGQVKGKLAGILKPEQLQQLNQFRPPQRNGGPGGDGEPGRGPGNEGPAGPGAPGGMGGGRPVHPVMEALDLNKDGVLDADEIAKASESLKKLDKNGDGKLSGDEVRPLRAGGPGANPRSGGGNRPQRPATE